MTIKITSILGFNCIVSGFLAASSYFCEVSVCLILVPSEATGGTWIQRILTFHIWLQRWKIGAAGGSLQPPPRLGWTQPWIGRGSCQMAYSWDLRGDTVLALNSYIWANNILERYNDIYIYMYITLVIGVIPFIIFMSRATSVQWLNIINFGDGWWGWILAYLILGGSFHGL